MYYLNSLIMFFVTLLSFPIYAQSIISLNSQVLETETKKIIPDKLLEIGIPLLILILTLNIIVTVLKNRHENKLKLRAIEKGVSEETLIQLFKESQMISKLQPLKIFLISGALGVGLIVIYLLRNLAFDSEGYLAIGIMMVFLSIAFCTYYIILNKKLK